MLRFSNGTYNYTDPLYAYHILLHSVRTTLKSATRMISSSFQQTWGSASRSTQVLISRITAQLVSS